MQIESARRMFTDTARVVDRPARARASVTNGTRLLAGVDGRSASARRFRDLVAELKAEYGGDRELTAAELGAIRQAAAMMLHAEQLQAAVVRGESVDSDTLIRLSGEARRLLASLRKRAPEPHVPLRDRLAAEAAARANSEGA